MYGLVLLFSMCCVYEMYVCTSPGWKPLPDMEIISDLTLEIIVIRFTHLIYAVISNWILDFSYFCFIFFVPVIVV